VASSHRRIGRPFLFSSEDWTAWKAAHTLHLEEMQTVSA